MTTFLHVDPFTDVRWHELVERGGGSLFHSPRWSRVLADTYGFSPRVVLMVDRDADDGPARAASGMPWCEIADPGGSRIVSLPFSDYCGPIGAPPFDAMVENLTNRGLPVLYKMLAHADDDADRRVTGTARWHGIAVTRSPDHDAWPLLSDSTRRAVNKARREGVTVVERTDVDFVDQFLRLHTGVRKRKYRLLPQPRAFFHSIRTEFDATGDWHPLAAVRDGELLAATVYLRHRSTLYYKFNASDPMTLGARPNDLVLWAGIELAARLGCGLVDLGASDDDQPGLIRFKRGFGAMEREIRSCAAGVPLSDAYTQFRGVLGEVTELLTAPDVPDPVTEAAGARLYRFFA